MHRRKDKRMRLRKDKPSCNQMSMLFKNDGSRRDSQWNVNKSGKATPPCITTVT